MKFLIWFLSGLLLFILNSMVAKATGFGLGYILMPVLWIFVSILLCRVYDNHRSKKRIKKITSKAEAEGMTAKEYIYKDVPQRCIEGCESNRGKPKELDYWLKYCVENGKISKEARIYLFEEYKEGKQGVKK